MLYSYYLYVKIHSFIYSVNVEPPIHESNEDKNIKTEYRNIKS